MFFVFFVVSAAAAADEASDDAETVETIVVTASRSPHRLTDVPAAVSVVDGDDIGLARQTVGMDESLNRVPGVFVQQSGNFAQDVRLQVRGFGSRAGFGIREVKVLLDGLPVTLADGQTEVDEVDLAAIDRIEVVRGTAAALYGNASGGVLHFFTRAAPAQPAAELRLTGGSFGLGKYQLAGGARGERAELFLSSSFFQLGGYRDHSSTERGSLIGTLRYRLDAATDIGLLLTGFDTLEAQDPGGLNAGEVAMDRRQARPGAARFDTGEEVLQGRLGVTVRRRLPAGELSAYGFGLYRDFESRLPIDPEFATPAQGGFVTFHRVAPGGGVSYAVAGRWLAAAHQLMLGLDVQHQSDARRRFDNDDGERGELGLRQDEDVTSLGPFARYAVSIGDAVELSVGLRYDRVRFDTDVSVPDPSDSGTRTFKAWSPAGGVRYSPLPYLTVFADVGTAFQVPTTTELANPDGPGLNRRLDPQTAVSGEVGVRLERQRLDAGATAFVVDVRDALVPFEVAEQPGRTFFRNAARSRRYGLELESHLEPLPDVHWRTAVTVLRARFREYDHPDPEADCCRDNDEPGIPVWQAYTELAYRHPAGFFAALEARLTDEFYVDDTNLVRSPEAAVCNLRLAYTRHVAGLTVTPFVGLQNLIDDEYDGRVRINAQGGRFFEPAPEFNVYGGVAVTAQ